MHTLKKSRKDLGSPICESFWLLKLFFKKSEGNLIRLVLVVIVFFSVFPILIVNVGMIEGTLRLQDINNGRGVLEHYGTWSQVFSCPVIVLITFILCYRMENVLSFLIRNLKADTQNKETDNFLMQILDILKCKTPQYKVILSLMMLFGLFSTIVNFQNTRQAILVYGQDVWDSSIHPLGFMVGKIFLGFMWIYLFPVIIYITCAIWLCTLLISNKIVFNEWIEVSPFAPDGCGGFREFGNTMIAITYITIPFICIIVAHIYTHSNFYITLLLATFFVGAASIAVLFLPFIQLHKFLLNHKNNLLKQLDDMFRQKKGYVFGDFNGHNQNSAPFLSLIVASDIYSQTKDMSTWPYLPVDFIKTVVPLLPSIIAIFIKVLIT